MVGEDGTLSISKFAFVNYHWIINRPHTKMTK